MRNVLLLALLALVGCHKKPASLPANALPASTTPAITIVLTADPLAIDLGESVVLNWRTTNAISASIDGIGDVPVNGTQTVAPASSTNFRLLAKGTGSTAEANVRVVVRVPSAPASGQTADAALTFTNVTADYEHTVTTAKHRRSSTTSYQKPTGKPVTTRPAPEVRKSDEAERIHDWIQQLRKGTIEHHVSGTMTMGKEYPAFVTIHPPKDIQTDPAAGTGAGAGVAAMKTPGLRQLRISPYMRVELDQDLNPGTFEIKPDRVCKLVSLDADTTFAFTVKPLTYGTNKELEFVTYVLYGDDTSACASGNLKVVPLESDREVVVIGAVDPGYSLQRAIIAFLTNPVKWFTYILPGGAGFAAVAKLIDWWKKRKKPPAPATPKPPGI